MATTVRWLRASTSPFGLPSPARGAAPGSRSGGRAATAALLLPLQPSPVLSSATTVWGRGVGRKVARVKCDAMAGGTAGDATGGGGGAAVPRVVIIGGGIVGASVAYYLAQRGVPATIVEREAVACAASGKAGGFLAKTWNDGSPVGRLTRVSYELHKELADTFGADAIGYRPVKTLQVVGSEAAGRTTSARVKEVLPAWLDGNVQMAEELAGPSTTAQVHPRLLTEALVRAAEAAGGRVVTGTAEGLQLSSDGQVQGVCVGGDTLPADVAVIAMGPWSAAASPWLRGTRVGISGQKYHSVVLRAETSEHCLFTSFRYASGRSVDPEVYPRPDGTVYCCGEPQALAVPDTPAGVTVQPELIDNILKAAGNLSSALSAAPVEATQACYLPIPAGNAPIIGAVPSVRGAYVATGHSCWGILNAPATGKALAELILDGRVSCLPGGLSAFDPARF